MTMFKRGDGYRFKYGVDGDGQEFEFYSDWGEDYLQWVAEGAAESYWYKHDGWDSQWPLEISLYDFDSRLLGKFSIDMRAEPRFSASEIKTGDQP